MMMMMMMNLLHEYSNNKQTRDQGYATPEVCILKIENSKLNPLEKLSCTGTPASKDLPRSILQRRAGLTCAPTSQQLRGKLELDGLIRSMIASTFDRVRRDTRRFKIVTE
jgi:hypothetical protein